MSVHIVKDLCKGCGYCVDTCPKAVFELRNNSEDLNAKGYYIPIVAKPELCTKCRMCELICPDFAIEVEE
jgi:2-oxoglutarate ferredoxin oxidoreductase subunit delta